PAGTLALLGGGGWAPWRALHGGGVAELSGDQDGGGFLHKNLEFTGGGKGDVAALQRGGCATFQLGGGEELLLVRQEGGGAQAPLEQCRGGAFRTEGGGGQIRDGLRAGGGSLAAVLELLGGGAGLVETLQRGGANLSSNIQQGGGAGGTHRGFGGGGACPCGDSGGGGGSAAILPRGGGGTASARPQMEGGGLATVTYPTGGGATVTYPTGGGGGLPAFSSRFQGGGGGFFILANWGGVLETAYRALGGGARL
ncbi:MGF factor, partial [Glaucidium brasilianum]|nr:MGF factor [Glaucidium brasilianum]